MECDKCKGRGTIRATRWLNWHPVDRIEKCKKCNGTGKIKGENNVR
jgi:DnaJ-class molecular chaperone